MTDNMVVSCPGQEETIYLFLDGELPPAEQAAFVTHLQHCQTCQALLAEIQTLFADLAALEPVASPSEVVSEVMAKLPSSDVSSRPVAAGQLILAGQLVIGVILLVITLPRVVSSHHVALPALSWPDLLRIVTILAGRLAMLSGNVVHWLQGRWYQAASFSVLNVSLEVALAIAAALALAWLISNTLLLVRNHYPLKNGGTS